MTHVQPAGSQTTIGLTGCDVVLRHKHDGCFEIYQDSFTSAQAPDIIHIDRDDLPLFIREVVRFVEAMTE